VPSHRLFTAFGDGSVEEISHSFHKTVATLIDDDGLSAGIAADQLGHSKVLMTQDRFRVAPALRAIINRN
jgi:integrase